MSQNVFTVSSLVHYLKVKIDQDMQVQSVLIQGEISNFTNHRSGHWYFTLKDAKARISCVMFSSYAARCGVVLKEGMKVIVKASLSVYEPYGSCQLYVTQVQVDGIGNLYLQFEELKKKLALEGLFDQRYKKPLPSYPMHIAVISAKEGAAIQDVLTTLKRRWPIARISFLPSLVQGKDASKQLIQRLQQAEQLQSDVILLVRGGGSLEDLWCFNDEALARTIFQMQSVVVSGVGHETDTTLVDYVADARAATPTAAAELVTPDQKEVMQSLMQMKQRICFSMQQKLQQEQRHLQQLANHRYIKDPLVFIQEEQMRLAMHVRALEIATQKRMHQRSDLRILSSRMAYAFSNCIQQTKQQVHKYEQTIQQQILEQLEKEKQRLGQQMHLLDAFSPLQVLKRGYSIVYENQRIVKSIHDIKQENLTIRMKDGLLHAMVTNKEEF